MTWLPNACRCLFLEAARLVDKVSQNLHAEILLRDVALKLTGRARREGGLAALAHFLRAPKSVRRLPFQRRLGTSRYNIVTPHAVATLLQYMAELPFAGSVDRVLPIGGVDGSLRSVSGRCDCTARFMPKPAA